MMKDQTKIQTLASRIPSQILKWYRRINKSCLFSVAIRFKCVLVLK